MIEIDNPLAGFAAAEFERITGPFRREVARLQTEAMRPFADYVAGAFADPRPRLTAVH